MALFQCKQYPYLLVIDPRDPGRELARFRDGLFETHDAFTIAELSKRAYIERLDGDADDGKDGRRYSYRVEFRRCGKSSCHCARGALHGPYIYGYYREAGKTKRKYLGRGGDRKSQRNRSEIEAKSDRSD